MKINKKPLPHMKAIIQEAYGDEQTLKMVDLPEPMVKHSNDIKIKVKVANITAGDRNLNTLALHPFVKFVMQLMFGFRKPRANIRGICGSGEVVAVGNAVTRFRIGDRVNFINSFGASVMAEYLILKESGILATFSENVSYVDAATVPFGLMTAYHFLNEHTLQSKNSILVYGASGPVGSAALSLANHFQLKVTAVASIKHHQALTQFTFKELANYQDESYQNIQPNFDIIFDAVGKMKRSDQRRLSKKKTVFFSVKSLTKESSKRLYKLNEWLAKGHLKVLIGRQFTFEEFQEAHRVVYAGHQTGNTVLHITKD